MNSWIIRYGELALKGGNRNIFEKKLVKNIKDYLKKNKVNHKEIKRTRGRIVVFSDHDCSCLKNVFGIISISPAIECDADIEDIKSAIIKDFIKKIKNKNFRVSTKRVDKSIKTTSIEIDKEIGAFVIEKTGSKVKLKDFEYELGIELINKKAYIFDKRVKARGGLPLGIEGTVYCLIEDKASLLASWLIMKRGCNIIPVSFKEKNIALINKYSTKDLESDIIKKIDELDKKRALVVNDTLDKIKDYDFKGLILRPIIAYSKEEIKEKLKEL